MRALLHACVAVLAIAAAMPSLSWAQTPAPSITKEMAALFQRASNDILDVAEAELAADGLGRAAGRARREEVVDDLDGTVEVEHALGLASERLRHGGHGVRRGERVLDGGRVSGILAEQRRVGPV